MLGYCPRYGHFNGAIDDVSICISQKKMLLSKKEHGEQKTNAELRPVKMALTAVIRPHRGFGCCTLEGSGSGVVDGSLFNGTPIVFLFFVFCGGGGGGFGPCFVVHYLVSFLGLHSPR